MLTGLKIIGIQHIQKMLNDIAIGVSQEDKRLAELISGFDMVNEEDFTPQIGEFAEPILQSREDVQIVKSDDPVVRE